MHMEDENLLSGYRKVSSFALHDGEHAVVRFVGGVDPEFVWTDSKGIDHKYLGINVFLYEHSSDIYQFQQGKETVMRVGLVSTLHDWIKDGGIKEDTMKLKFKVDMSKTLGYGLRVEGRAND
jgi:hypothetical protein